MKVIHPTATFTMYKYQVVPIHHGGTEIRVFADALFQPVAATALDLIKSGAVWSAGADPKKRVALAFDLARELHRRAKAEGLVLQLPDPKLPASDHTPKPTRATKKR